MISFSILYHFYHDLSIYHKYEKIILVLYKKITKIKETINAFRHLSIYNIINYFIYKRSVGNNNLTNG